MENFSAGLGIVYYPGGPRAEGATDFLWFLCLSGLVKLGIDVAVAAAVLNAIGVGFAVYLFRVASATSGSARGATVITLGAAIALLTSGGAVAGYSGFSAMWYSALTLVLFALLLEASPERLVWVPLLGLIVALVRPEGVVVGGVSTIVAAVLVRSNPTVFRRLFFAAAGAAAVGAGYFCWRWWYFGYLLPLPLYVKSHGPMLAGMSKTLAWMESAGGPIPLAVGAIVLWALQREPRAGALRTLAALMPLMALIVALCFGNQIQNVGCRFQAPVIMALFFLLVQFAATVHRENPTGFLRFIAPAILIAALTPSVWFWGTRTGWLIQNRNRTYVDTFAPQLASRLNQESVIALTEAGRLGFWTSGRVEDMVGLNSPEIALHPPTLDYLRTLNPDVVMFHTAATLEDQLLPSLDSPAVVDVSSDLFARAVKPKYREGFLHGFESYSATHFTPPIIAALSLERFLSETPGYRIFNVRFGNSRGHFYGFRERLKHLDAVIEDLRHACQCAEEPACEDYRSYASLRGLWFQRE